MKKYIFVIAVLCCISCNFGKKNETVVITKGKVQKQSEMAALMLLMYQKNAENKKMILGGEAPKVFPEEFLEIHTATLTDPKDRKPEFKAYSDFYIETLRKVFVGERDSLKLKHNNVVNSCITCHKTTCIGPIPKIKKLLINE